MSVQQSSLIDQLLKTVDAVGYEKTDEILKAAQFEKIKFPNPTVERVVTIIADAFEIKVYEILHGTGRKNNRKYAIGFCAYYLHHFTDRFKMEDVCMFLNKDVTLCWKYCKQITKLNPKHPAQKKYGELKMKFDAIFVNI